MAHFPLLKSYMFSGVCFCAHFTRRTFQINSSMAPNYTEHIFTRSVHKKIFFFLCMSAILCSKKLSPFYRECVSQTMLHISQENSSITLYLSQHENFQYFFFWDIKYPAKKVTGYHGYGLFYNTFCWWHTRLVCTNMP